MGLQPALTTIVATTTIFCSFLPQRGVTIASIDTFVCPCSCFSLLWTARAFSHSYQGKKINRNCNTTFPSPDAGDVFCGVLAVSVPSSSPVTGLSWRHESSKGAGEGKI